MKTIRWITAGVGLLMLLISIWQLEISDSGLTITHLQAGDLPVTLISPAGDSIGDRPLVLIGHGVAGSRVIMRGFALTMAHAGYNVAMWDFAGHGSNPLPLPTDRESDTLVKDAEAALLVAQENGLGTTGQVAVLGHSMGSGMALSYGVMHPETMATIAVSPVDRPVTPQLPRNLLLLAEGLDQRFVRNAEDLLQAAGGLGGDVLAGTARRMVIVPGVEHITILFSPSAHQEARQWLDSTFGIQPQAQEYSDRRIWWYVLGLVGTFLTFWSLAPLVTGSDVESYEQPTMPLQRRIGALIVGALGATSILYVLSQAGLQLNDLLGLLVGGYMLLWFAIAGALSMLLLGRMPAQLAWPPILGSLLVFAILWIGVGLLGSYVWLPWLLIPKRLILWPLGVVLSLPWLLAVAQSMLPTRRLGRFAWWLGYSMILVGALFLSIRLNPELSFLVLILPVFPVILGLHAIAAGPYRWRTTFALGGALFIGWLVLAVFPLQ
ncbi:alpha/beta hydrolase family protein [Chloroflexota bacterium]